jgi:DNA (cytosine-5)-methyltransferase 1
MGYHRAGFEVVGVDIKPQPHYPFPFFLGDALDVLEWLTDYQTFRMDEDRYDLDLTTFDAIHTSPPCQAYSVLRRANPEAKYPDLIAPTRDLLEQTGLPWVIENVPGSPTHHLIVLCGSMFGLGCVSGDGVKAEIRYRQLRRHRNFETSFPIMSPPCLHRGEVIGAYGGGPVGRYTFDHGAKKDRYGRRGGYQGTIAEKREAMGIDWMTSAEINQAIPPAYTEFIGAALLQHIRSEVAA